MMNILDLIDRYPQSPGYRDRDTSKSAAESMAGRTPALRGKVLSALRAHGPMTADETAEIICETVLSCRPRFTECLALGLIIDTGTRRANSSGRSAKVFRLV